MHGDLNVRVFMDGWDSETFDDDRLGTVDKRYTIDSLWGLDENPTHWRGDFCAVYRFRNPLPYNQHEFRQQMYWRFKNFFTHHLTRQQFAETFRDVANDELAIWHPFDYLFYTLVYMGMAKGGNCFGMCLESIYAQVGRSIFSEPINRCAADSLSMNEINIKHGYQVGAKMIDYVLKVFLTGGANDPVGVFRASRDSYEMGDYPIIGLMSSDIGGSGHAVRPYKWDDSKKPWIISIANPNDPPPEPDDDMNNRIEVDPDKNTFRFALTSADVWTGGEWIGGKMYTVPFNLVCDWPRTPFWEAFMALIDPAFIILGDDGQTTQITDSHGRTLYEPNIPGGSTKWEHIRRDPQKRIPGMYRLPFIHANAAGRLPEMYANWDGDSLTHSINASANGKYRWGIRSIAMSAVATVPAVRGLIDKLATDNFRGPNPIITFMPASGGGQRNASIAMAAFAQSKAHRRIIELTRLPLTAGKTIRVQLADNGQEMRIENSGPEITVDVRLQAVADSKAELKRANLKLEAGKTFSIRPADWSPAAITKSPLKLATVESLSGKIVKVLDA